MAMPALAYRAHFVSTEAHNPHPGSHAVEMALDLTKWAGFPANRYQCRFDSAEQVVHDQKRQKPTDELWSKAPEQFGLERISGT